MKTTTEITTRDRFFSPLKKAIETAINSRVCKKFTDWDFLQAGVGRCLETPRSGRDWVQRLPQFLSRLTNPITTSDFFEALRSTRRLKLLREVNETIIEACGEAAVRDPFAEHDELDGFAIYAGDGHYHTCSTHEDDIGGKRRPIGHFFALNMRHHALRHLDIARPDILKGKKGEHDMGVLKRLPAKTLRMGEPRGTKVLLAYDCAVVGFQQWYKWKQGSGIYIITRETGNMKLEVMGEHEVERTDPRNHGVEADQLVSHSQGYAIRRIIYTDPVTGTAYRFITNEMTVPPGLLAYIYKKRWDLEKLFDEFKNQLNEKKAWAKSDTAKSQQGTFMCLAHNLTVLLEDVLKADEDIVDEKVLRRIEQRHQAQSALAAKAGRPMNPLLSIAKRATQRSSQFLRWLRAQLTFPTPWRQAIAALRPLMNKYI